MIRWLNFEVQWSFPKESRVFCLFTNFLDEITQYIKDVQSLRSTDVINYKHLKGLLKNVERKLNYPDTYKFDWVIVTELEKFAYLKSLTI